MITEHVTIHLDTTDPRYAQLWPYADTETGEVEIEIEVCCYAAVRQTWEEPGWPAYAEADAGWFVVEGSRYGLPPWVCDLLSYDEIEESALGQAADDDGRY